MVTPKHIKFFRKYSEHVASSNCFLSKYCSPTNFILRQNFAASTLASPKYFVQPWLVLSACLVKVFWFQATNLLLQLLFTIEHSIFYVTYFYFPQVRSYTHFGIDPQINQGSDQGSDNDHIR